MGGGDGSRVGEEGGVVVWDTPRLGVKAAGNVVSV